MVRKAAPVAGGPLGLFDPADTDQRELAHVSRDEAAYAAMLRKAVYEPSALDTYERAPLQPDTRADLASDRYGNLYQRAANLAAKAHFDPSNMTTAEHIELLELRQELEEKYGVALP